MNINEFNQIDMHMRKKYTKLFYMATPDKPASVAELKEVEELLGVNLPVSYKDFLREYGGGEYCLLTIYSADPASEWYLPVQVSHASSYLPKGLIPISDDYCGGHHVLIVNNATANDHIWYWNTDGGLVQTEYETVLDFISHNAYE